MGPVRPHASWHEGLSADHRDVLVERRASMDNSARRSCLILCECSARPNHIRHGADWRPRSHPSDMSSFRSLRVNVRDGEPEDRRMATGLHTVRDIFCAKCGRIMGWKYVSLIERRPGVPSVSRQAWLIQVLSLLPQDKAYDNEQKYKEGKYILEKTRLSEVQ